MTALKPALRSWPGWVAVAVATCVLVVALGYQRASDREVEQLVEAVGANLILMVVPTALSAEELAPLEEWPEIELAAGQGPVGYFHAPDVQHTAGWQLVTPNFLRTLNLKLALGDGFSPEVPKGVILGWEVKEVLFPGENPVGQELDGHPILGVLAPIPPEDRLRERWNRRVLTTQPREGISAGVGTSEGFQFVYLRAAGDVERAMRALAARFPEAELRSAKDVYGFWFLLARILNQILASAALGLLFLATLLLTIAAVVSTYRRTRELGIRRAVGAPPHAVMLQLVQEGLITAALGGMVGAVVGGGVVLASQPTMSLWWPQALVVPGAMVAVLPGIVLPAWWAARIPPVEALRRRSPLGRRHGWGWMHLLIALGLAIAFLYAYLVHQTALGVDRYLQLSWGSLDERLLLIRSPRESILPPPPLAWEDAALIAGVPGVQLVVPIASQPIGAGRTKAAVGSGVLELGFPPVIEGRGFTPEDFSAPRPVCLISERLARELGLKLAENPTLPVVGVDFQVVGVFEDSYIRSEFPVDVLFTEHYLELVPLRTMRFLVWVARRSDVAGVREEITNRFAARYPGKAKVQVTQAGGTQAEAVRFFRAGALRMGIAALAALVLATGQALGLIGFLLARRQLEYGIRRAVGAPPRQIIFSVVRETASVSSFALVLAILVGALLSPHFLSWFMLLPQPPWWGSLPPLLGVAALIAGGASLPAWKTCRQAPAILVEGSRE